MSRRHPGASHVIILAAFFFVLSLLFRQSLFSVLGVLFSSLLVLYFEGRGRRGLTFGTWVLL